MSEAVAGEVLPAGPGGRPSELTPEVVQKLEAAFNNGFNITEACMYAGVPRSTYYTWLADNDWFSYKMSVAQAAPNMKAKQKLIEAIEAGDLTTMRWYLERRDSDFKAKGELEITPGQITTEEKLKEFMDDTDDGAYDAIGTGTDDVGGEPPAAAESESGVEVAQSPEDISE